MRIRLMGRDLVLTAVALVLVSSVVAAELTIPIRPDHRLTPGATMVVGPSKLCVSGYSATVRNVPESRKDSAYAEYGIKHHVTGQYEVDHLISLELGGSNDLKNLWPQSYETQPWNARVKDKLENALHRAVCDGKMKLADAQHAIATDWIAAYKTQFGVNAP
jgi:hypothetical protein